MGIVDNYFEKKVSPIKSELQTVKSENESLKKSLEEVNKGLDTQIYQLKNLQAPDIKASEFIKQYREWLYININVIAEAVAKIKFRLYRLKKSGKNEVEEIKEHPILELLYRMNPYMTKEEVIYTLEIQKPLVGDACWYLARANRDNPKEPPTEIWPLRSDWISIKQGQLDKGQDFIAYYVYKIPGQEEQIFMPHEILMFKKPNPEDPYRGMSIVKAAAVSIDIDNFATNWNRNFFWNSARPDAVLSTEQKLDNEVLKRLKNQFRSEYGGLSNSMKMMILEAGLSYKPFQSSVKDMDFLEQQKWTRDKFISFFGNTKIALGIVEDVNRANAETSEYIQQKNTTDPEMQKLVDTLNEFLVPLYGEDLFLSYESPIPEAVELLNDELSKLTNLVYTINEARAKKGLDPIPEGDVLYLPLNVSPITDNNPDQQGKGYVTVRGKHKGNSYKDYLPERDFSEEIRRLNNRNLRRKSMANALKENQVKIEKEIKKALLKRRKDQRKLKRKENFWKVQIANSDLYEAKVEKIMEEKIYPYISSEVQQNINDKMKISSSELMFDEANAVTFSIRAFDAIFKEIVTIQGNKAYEYLGLKETMRIDQVIANKIKSQIRKFSKSMTKTIREKLTNSLTEGLNNGESGQKLTKRVSDAIGDIKTYQARRISVTEVSRATNYANSVVWSKSGVKEEEWLTALDERVCPDCSSMEGKVSKLSESYFNEGDSLPSGATVTYENIKRPPLHVSCRCTTIPVVEKD